MAVYTTEAAVRLMLGTDLVTDLLDLDEDNASDAGLMTATIADVAAIIDSRLAERYAVPFADIAATPPTPAIVQLIAKWLCAVQLLVKRTDQASQRDAYAKMAEDELARILAGTTSIPGAARADASAGASGFSYESSGLPAFASIDDDGRDPMERW